MKSWRGHHHCLYHSNGARSSDMKPALDTLPALDRAEGGDVQKIPAHEHQLAHDACDYRFRNPIPDCRRIEGFGATPVDADAQGARGQGGADKGSEAWRKAGAGMEWGQPCGRRHGGRHRLERREVCLSLPSPPPSPAPAGPAPGSSGSLNECSYKIRCAIYTRKSSEEGLEQPFNSLDAQYDAAAAYVLSQRHEGWKLVAERYDDGGLSGGTMNRPALLRLLR